MSFKAFTMVALLGVSLFQGTCVLASSGALEIGKSLDEPRKEVFSEQPPMMKPVIPVTGYNFEFKGENAITWGPLHLYTASRGSGFGGQTRGGVDRLLVPAQMLFLLEHSMDDPGAVRGYTPDEANIVSARGISYYLIDKGLFDESHAARFIEVVTKCMRTSAGREALPTDYHSFEDRTFCRGVSTPPDAQLKDVVGSAVLEDYIKHQAQKILDKYLDRLDPVSRREVEQELAAHIHANL